VSEAPLPGTRLQLVSYLYQHKVKKARKMRQMMSQLSVSVTEKGLNGMKLELKSTNTHIEYTAKKG
jgi:hypothetical protein